MRLFHKNLKVPRSHFNIHIGLDFFIKAKPQTVELAPFSRSKNILLRQLKLHKINITF